MAANDEQEPFQKRTVSPAGFGFGSVPAPLLTLSLGAKPLGKVKTGAYTPRITSTADRGPPVAVDLGLFNGGAMTRPGPETRPRIGGGRNVETDDAIAPDRLSPPHARPLADPPAPRPHPTGRRG